jgi:hypothetical protein
MPFRGMHAIPTVFVTILVVAGLAAAAPAVDASHWPFSSRVASVHDCGFSL